MLLGFMTRFFWSTLSRRFDAPCVCACCGRGARVRGCWSCPHIRRCSGLHAHACGMSSCLAASLVGFLSCLLSCVPIVCLVPFLFSLCLVAVSGSFLSLLLRCAYVYYWFTAPLLCTGLSWCYVSSLLLIGYYLMLCFFDFSRLATMFLFASWFTASLLNAG